MSVLIKGMEMPTNCEDCVLLDEEHSKCKLHDNGFRTWNEEYAHCPLVSADEVKTVVHGRYEKGACSVCGSWIPTDTLHECIWGDELNYCYYCGAKMENEDAEPMTNADKIRAMRTTELAEFLDDVECNCGRIHYPFTLELWRDWLKQEATE